MAISAAGFAQRADARRSSRTSTPRPKPGDRDRLLHHAHVHITDGSDATASLKPPPAKGSCR